MNMLLFLMPCEHHQKDRDSTFARNSAEMRLTPDEMRAA